MVTTASAQETDEQHEHEDQPLFELPAGSVEEPIMTLDLAQRIGIGTARSAVAEAQKHWQETLQLLDRVYLSVGLTPDRDYDIDDEGHVFAGPPRPNA